MAIAAAGGIPPLVALVRDGDAGGKEQAAGALRSLAVNADNQVAIARAGGIEPLVALARSGTDGQKEHAAAALRNLAVNDDNQIIQLVVRGEHGRFPNGTFVTFAIAEDNEGPIIGAILPGSERKAGPHAHPVTK